MPMTARTDDEMRDHLILNSRRTPTGCWEWLRAMYSNGYGAVGYQGRQRLVHRISYEVFVGPIPEGLTLDHLCRNRACINPSHLEPVTQRENLLRGQTLTAAYAQRTLCKKGHPLITRSRGGRWCPQCHADNERENRKTPKRQAVIRAYREKNRDRINENWRKNYHKKKGERDASN